MSRKAAALPAPADGSSRDDGFENVSSFLGQDHQRPVFSDCRNGLHEAFALEVSEITAAWVQCLAVSVSQVAGGDDTESPDGREGARFGTAQPDFVVAGSDPLALGTARQMRSLVNTSRGSKQRGRASLMTAAAALAQFASVIVLARIVRPTRIELIHANLQKNARRNRSRCRA